MLRTKIQKWMLDLEQTINASLKIDEPGQVERDRAWALEPHNHHLLFFPFIWR